MKAERVPADDVGVLDGAIGRSPCGKTFMTLAAGDVGAGGVELIGMVGGDPHLMLGEGADPLGGILGGDDGNGGCARPNFVAAGTPHRPLVAGVDEGPPCWVCTDEGEDGG